MMQNFLGNFDCTLDSKGRLMIPARFRHQIPEASGGEYVISMGKDRCLNLYPLKEWDEVVVKKLHELPSGPEKRQYIRFYSRKSRTVNLDKSGRIAIPANFLEAIGNPGKVVVVGVLNYLEIWTPEDHAKMSKDGDEAFLEGDWEY
ncbi:MAG: cell division/cell wall cluster transcriptional repressor MraZ [Candidatus Krumholzibacteriota bacterium]|nr:cell division/cell wall cluster transcriptional repressor MraZ [Candidatus Krumholzibacteriota bacterium]